MSRLESYELTTTDLLACAGTLGTAAPYAWRHLQKSLTTEEGKWGHRIIAILESIPLGVGFLVGLVERILVHCYSNTASGAASDSKQEAKPLTSRVKSILEEEDAAEKSEEKPIDPKQSEKKTPVEPDFKPILPAADWISDIAELPKPDAIPPHASWRKRALTIDECARKAIKNLEKARRHHILDDLSQPRSTRDLVQIPNYFDVGPLPEVEELASAQKLVEPLSFSISHAELWAGAGQRASDAPRTPNIEDAHFAKMLNGNGDQPRGCYFGLFDGHGGTAVAQFAASLCMNNFETFLAAAGSNTHQALELLLEWVEKEIKKKFDSAGGSKWSSGSTVVLGFIDSHTGIATVATLADAEVSRYTVDEREPAAAKLLPLSPLLSWKDQKEIDRAKKEKGLAILWGRLGGCLAVSRALGDCSYKGISHKPKITQCRVKKGQIILAACDGLRENAFKRLKICPEQHIAEQIARYQKEGDPEGRSLAEVLVASAETYSTDDISAMAIVVG